MFQLISHHPLLSIQQLPMPSAYCCSTSLIYRDFDGFSPFDQSIVQNHCGKRVIGSFLKVIVYA
jgi:hypothetical protein